MRNAVILLVLAVSAPAAASTLNGEVVDVRSRWTSDGARIVSDVTVLRDDGSEVVLLQPGGTVNGLSMRVLHAPALPWLGARVEATYRDARTGAGRAVRVVESMEPLASPAAWYVNTRTNESRRPLYWESGCVYITLDEAGTSDIDNEAAIITQVLDTWEFAIDDCSYMRFELEGTSSDAVGYDGLNVILFRENRWCRPATKDEPEMCYSSAAAALTTLFFVDDPASDRDGQIVDADIEMNAVNFSVSSDGATNGDAPCMADLANTLTHEVGHLLGLDHTCWDGIPPRPIDENGDSVPSCSPESSLPDEVKEATMYNFQTCGETKKATLEQDDIDAICALYPLSADPGHCRRVSLSDGGGCCAIGPGRRHTDGPGLGAGLLALLGVIAIGRVRARGCRGANRTARARTRRRAARRPSRR